MYHGWLGVILKWLLPVGILHSSAIAGEGTPDVLACHDVRRICCPRSGVPGLLAHTDDDVTAEVDYADRYERREPRGYCLCRPCEVSRGPAGFYRFTRGSGFIEEVSADSASGVTARAVLSHWRGASFLGSG